MWGISRLLLPARLIPLGVEAMGKLFLIPDYFTPVIPIILNPYMHAWLVLVVFRVLGIHHSEMSDLTGNIIIFLRDHHGRRGHIGCRARTGIGLIGCISLRTFIFPGLSACRFGKTNWQFFRPESPVQRKALFLSPSPCLSFQIPL